MSRHAGTPSLGPVSHQVDGLGAIIVSDAGTPYSQDIISAICIERATVNTENSNLTSLV